MPVRTKPNAPARAAPHDALPRLDHFKPKCGPVAKSKNSRWRAIVLVSVYLLVGLHVVHWLLAGRTITPVEPSEAMQTLEGGYVNAGAILFVLLIASTLVFGRWFCGWACHIVALQDLCAWLLGKVGLRPRPVRSRLLILVPFAAAFYMFAWPTVKRWWHGSPAPALDWSSQLATDDLWRTFPGFWMGMATFAVCGFLVVWWLGAKGFCTYGCPYGAIFAVADRFAPGRIRVTDACEHCGHCTSVCTSNVRVHEEVAVHGMVVDPGCMKCMDCVSVCPKEALYFGFGWPSPVKLSQQRRAARADFTWPEEVLMAVVGFASFQWAWRGAWLLIEGVPLLMAIGLGVITAMAVLLGERLLLRREVSFQHWPLKIGGRLTGRGWLAAVAIIALAGMVGSLAVANGLRAHALEVSATPLRAVQEGRHPPAAAVQEAEAATARALSWSLGRDVVLVEHEGLLLRELGRHDEAMQTLDEAVRRSRWVPERGGVALAIYLQAAGRAGDALALARNVVERSTRMGHPNRTAQVLVEQLGGR
jgi:ferredoxin